MGNNYYQPRIDAEPERYVILSFLQVKPPHPSSVHSGAFTLTDQSCVNTSVQSNYLLLDMNLSYLNKCILATGTNNFISNNLYLQKFIFFDNTLPIVTLNHDVCPVRTFL